MAWKIWEENEISKKKNNKFIDIQNSLPNGAKNRTIENGNQLSIRRNFSDVVQSHF